MRSPSLQSVATALAVAFTLSFATPAVAADGDPFPAASLAPQVTAGPASPDNDLAPRWEFSAPDLGAFECSLTRDDTLVGDWAPCTSPAAYDLSSQPDGTYTFAVRERLADGTTSDVASSQYVLDTSTPPQPTIIDLPGPVASDRTPDWTFAGGSGESFECRIGDADWAPCASPYSVDLGDQPDGTYLFSVRGIAADGTPGPARTDSYLLDTSAPAAPEIDTGLPAASNSATATVAFSTEPNAQVECRATGADATPDWAPCTSPYTFDLSGRPDGDYRLALRATDAAGNTGPEATADYTLDTTAPDAPAVDTPTATPATMLQPSFGFTGEPDAAFECRLGDAGWLPCTSPAPYDLTGKPDGDYTFAVRATDPAGNTSQAGTTTYHLARVPGAVDLRSGPGRIGNDRRPRWTFNIPGGSSFVCAMTSPTGAAGNPVACGSPWTADLRGRPDRSYSLTVTAGNGHAPVTQTYELDSTAPAKPTLDAAPVSPAADRGPAWHFSGEDGASLDCRVTRGAATVVDWTACNNPRQFDLSNAPDGAYQVTARATDAAGNVGAPVASAYTLDTTAPATPALTAVPDASDIDRSPTWSFDGEPDAVFSCSLTRGSVVVSTSSTCAGAKTYNLSGAEPGTYTFAVKATDAAGNTSKAKVASYVLAKTPAVASSGDNGSGSGSLNTGDGTSDGTTGTGGGSDPVTVPPTTAGTPTATGGFTTDTTSSGSAHATGPSESAAAPTVPHAAPSVSSPERPGQTSRRRAAAAATTSPRANPVGTDHHSARKRKGFVRTLTNGIGDATRGTARAVNSDVGRVVFPFSILVILAGFLLVQNRIDRRDPKLALAPIDADPDLEFGPPPSLR